MHHDRKTPREDLPQEPRYSARPKAPCHVSAKGPLGDTAPIIRASLARTDVRSSRVAVKAADFTARHHAVQAHEAQQVFHLQPCRDMRHGGAGAERDFI